MHMYNEYGQALTELYKVDMEILYKWFLHLLHG